MLRSMVVVALLASSAFAQQPDCRERTVDCKPKAPKVVPKKAPAKPPTYDMGAISVDAKNRKVMLMTFLERAREELERASLQQRSFIPELVKTVDAEQL
jgi:hypothetical protein